MVAMAPLIAVQVMGVSYNMKLKKASTPAAAIIGIVLYRELAGVREGTIVAAVLVGMIARRLNCTIGPRVNHLLVR